MDRPSGKKRERSVRRPVKQHGRENSANNYTDWAGDNNARPRKMNLVLLALGLLDLLQSELLCPCGSTNRLGRQMLFNHNFHGEWAFGGATHIHSQADLFDF